jgi:Putative beta-barrel porin 2
MKHNLIRIAFPVLLAGAASAQEGLYSVGADAQDSIPLKWVVGVSGIYDDNVNSGSGGLEEDSFAINPSLGLSFVSISPQTTWDVFVSLGLVYYLDAPSTTDDLNNQSRIGVNLTHRFSERLRFVSRNFISYEMEPDYAYGYASARTTGEYFYWSTDNSVGYRWSERVGTYTGLVISGTTYADVNDNDRLNWQAYNQFRYQLSPQTVLTQDYRYGQTSGDGNSSDSDEHYLLVGVEHRFSPSTIGILQTGAQFRSVDDGDSNTSPYLEASFRTQMNEQFSIRSFARYGMEYYDTVQLLPIGSVEYDDKTTFRLGVTAEYLISPKLSLFGGVDYIPTSFQDGRALPPLLPGTPVPDSDEDLINAHIGLSLRFTDFVTGSLTYNFTSSSSDIVYRDYDRNRISLGVSAEF